MSARGRLALVVGGTGGIGTAICRELAADDHRVAVADVDKDRVAEAAEQVGGVPVVMDITDPGSVESALERLRAETGAVSVCVNGAGWDEFRPFVTVDEAFIEKVIAINYTGVVRVTRAVLPEMLKAGWGRIINIASDAGRVGSSLEAVYAGAKGGVIAFGKAVAREAARSTVTVNTVCPGPTATPMLERAAAPMDDSEKFVGALTKAVPMRRLGEPADIAPAVRFLASDEAGYITGQTLSISGGLTMA